MKCPECGSNKTVNPTQDPLLCLDCGEVLEGSLPIKDRFFQFLDSHWGRFIVCMILVITGLIWLFLENA